LSIVIFPQKSIGDRLVITHHHSSQTLKPFHQLPGSSTACTFEKRFVVDFRTVQKQKKDRESLPSLLIFPRFFVPTETVALDRSITKQHTNKYTTQPQEWYSTLSI
jgi:hypothetical protein